MATLEDLNQQQNEELQEQKKILIEQLGQTAKDSSLYFSSNWHYGLGGFDIFKSEVNYKDSSSQYFKAANGFLRTSDGCLSSSPSSPSSNGSAPGLTDPPLQYAGARFFRASF